MAKVNVSKLLSDKNTDINSTGYWYKDDWNHLTDNKKYLYITLKRGNK